MLTCLSVSSVSSLPADVSAKANQDLGDTLEEGRDGEIIWVEDPATAMKGVDFGSIPPDQIGLENTAAGYEEQSLNVSQLAMGGGPKVTATQASLQASFSQINREWMQLRVADCYRTIVRNSLRMMADPRYTPKTFLINVAQNDADPVFEAVTANLLRVRFKVDIQAGSMQPLTEQLEREDALQLFPFTIGLPEIKPQRSDKGLLKAFRVKTPTSTWVSRKTPTPSRRLTLKTSPTSSPVVTLASRRKKTTRSTFRPIRPYSSCRSFNNLPAQQLAGLAGRPDPYGAAPAVPRPDGAGRRTASYGCRRRTGQRGRRRHRKPRTVAGARDESSSATRTGTRLNDGISRL